MPDEGHQDRPDDDAIIDAEIVEPDVLGVGVEIDEPVLGAEIAPAGTREEVAAGDAHWCKSCATLRRLKPEMLARFRCPTPGCPRFTLGEPLPPPLGEEAAGAPCPWCPHPLSRHSPDGRCHVLGCDCPLGGSSSQRHPTGSGMYIGPGGGLLTATLCADLRKVIPMALTEENKVALYRDGVYVPDPNRLQHTIGQILGDDWIPGHTSAVEKFLAGELSAEERYLTIALPKPLLPLSNGVLDLPTALLLPHSPDYLTSIQLPVEWDPAAQCPTYEQWLHQVIPDQADDLEEVASTMLDLSRAPSKALLAYGPSRSGKSTFLRIMEAMVGSKKLVSAVSLQALATDQFARANLYGKILNIAADLSAKHVDDISSFKLLTGDDLVHGNRKYGKQFAFRNLALCAFSCNELPTVGETSTAYIERMKPFYFGRSFAGREDPQIEAQMKTELSGILVRWVRANQRLRARGGYAPTSADVMGEFIARSNLAAMFVRDSCTVHPVAPGGALPDVWVTTKRLLRAQFLAWAKATGERGAATMGERKFIDMLLSVDEVEECRAGDGPRRGQRGVNVTVDKDWAEEVGR